MRCILRRLAGQVQKRLHGAPWGWLRLHWGLLQHWWYEHDAPQFRRGLLVLGLVCVVVGLAVHARLWRAEPTKGPPPSGRATSQGAPYAARPGQRLSSLRDGDLDTIVRGGTIIDGSGAPRYVADVGLADGRVVAIGDLTGLRARREIDARGLFVTPGFINTHSHTYETIAANPDATSAIMQGITLEVGGVDGRSPIDLDAHFARVMKAGTAVNYAMYVGQGSVRQAVMGTAKRPATAKELQAMTALVRRAVKAGAFGLSSGLEYVPGKDTSTEELIALARAAAAAGGPGTIYSTHMRSEGAQIIGAVEEALQVAMESGLTLKISHLKIVYQENWSKASRLVELIDGVRAAGLPVWADMYPYLAPDYTSNVSLRTVFGKVSPEQVTIRVSRLDEWLGRTLADIARSLGIAPAAAGRAVAARDPDARAVEAVISETVLETFLRSPWAMLTNDASARPWYNDYERASGLHPRTYGAFPRFLAHYARDEQLMNWEQGIQFVTGRPAALLDLPDRGLVREGYHADLVILSPEKLRDTATYVEPQSYPEGIEYVFVNGVCVVDRGRHLEGVRPGEIVRRVR